MVNRHLVSQFMVVVALAAPQIAGAQRTAPLSAEAAQEAADAAAFRGDFVAAANHWKDAADLYSKTAKAAAHAHALVRLSEAQQAVGDYQGAADVLNEALAIAARTKDALLTATVRGALGNLQSTLIPLRSSASQRTALAADARRNLEEALQAAQSANHVLLAASLAINLGNHLALTETAAPALGAYEKAATLAEQGRSPSLASRAFANHARVALLGGQRDAAVRSLKSAQAFANVLPPSHDTVFTLTSIAHSYAALPGGREAVDSPGAFAAAEQTYRKAIATAGQIDDVLGESYARGFLGQLYEQAKRFDEALHESRRAVFAGMLAQDRLAHVGTSAERSASGMSGAAGDALQRWHYQIGRLHLAAGRHDAALTSARAAANVLEAIRFEVTTPYGITSATFRDTVEPVFHFLVRLLLDRSRTVAPDDPQLRRELIVEARARVESLKAAELRDYFQDDCVDALLAAERDAGSVDPTAAIIYPIVLADRTEIVVSFPGDRLDHFVVPVTRAQITASVGRFRRCIGDSTCFEFFEDGQRLYEWLIKPMETSLSAAGIRTLVFAPDAALRTIPMAALFDGKQYLIERYAVATIPALNLVDPRPFERGGELRVLRTGLSQAVAAGQAPLPQVRSELEGVGALYPSGDVLLDGDFTTARLQGLLAQNRYSVVHIASHGEFSNDASLAYLQTSGGPLLMDELAGSISQLRFRGLPATGSGLGTTALELIVLSACETAEGDERAALGLAGLAIKSGARSAVGTLWNVNDQAASDLIVEFYRQLKTDPAVSKAEALRRAQRKTLEGRFEHPQYWSPFLLISNWL